MARNKRRITIVVTAQTAHNLRLLADMADLKHEGQVVDKLTRGRMVSLRRQEHKQQREQKKFEEEWEMKRIGFI